MKGIATLVMLCLAASTAWSQQPTSARDRIRAIRKLADSGGSTAIPEIRGYLKDSDVEVRVEAVKAIVAIGTQHSLDALVEATADNDAEIQARATDGLVNFYYPGYVQTGFTATLRRAGSSIRGRFSDNNDQVIDPFVQVRPDIIEALGKLARGGMGLEVRANAARALGVLRGKAAGADLIQAIRTKDSLIIYEVLVAFKKIRDPEVAPLISFLARDTEEKVQLAALETLGLLGNKAALADLTEALSRAEDDDVRAAALTAIGRLPDESNRRLFEQHLGDRKEDLRVAAAEGLSRLLNPADAPKLEAAFRNERNMKARLSQAFGVVLLGRRDMSEFGALRYLVNTLNSSSWSGVAYAYLVELARESKVRAALYPLMNERTRDEKLRLAGVFGRSGGEDAVPVLEALSRDTDMQVAQEGTKSLRVLKERIP